MFSKLFRAGFEPRPRFDLHRVLISSQRLNGCTTRRGERRMAQADPANLSAIAGPVRPSFTLVARRRRRYQAFALPIFGMLYRHPIAICYQSPSLITK
jgi:hypothetical protein